MTSFERHGITHLSVSSVALFANEPAMFVAERLMKRRAPVGPSAHRGTAVEAGIVKGLLDHGAPLEDCQFLALEEFDKLVRPKPFAQPDQKADKERAGIAGMVEQGILRLRPRGIPTQVQGRIEVTLPGVPLPWIGYLDLHYEELGTTVDIKTTLRLPSQPTLGHSRQLALYTYGTNHTARVIYCTSTKSEVYVIENTAQHIKDLINIAQRLERFLGVSDDPAFLASIVTPNLDSYYWGTKEARELAREIYGL